MSWEGESSSCTPEMEGALGAILELLLEQQKMQQEQQQVLLYLTVQQKDELAQHRQ